MAKGEEQKRELRKIQAYKRTFNTEDGRAVLKDLKEQTGLFRQSHQCPGTLEEQSALKNLMLYIMDCIGFDAQKLEHEIDTEENFDTLNLAPDEGFDGDIDL